MINTMAKRHDKDSQSTKSVSGAYLVMLRRHLARLQEIASLSNKQTKICTQADRQEHIIAIKDISPLIKAIEALAGHACFGLDIGKYMHPSDYGIFVYTMMNCETLLCALKTACEHKNVLNQKFYAEFISDEDHIIYQLNTEQESKEIQILIELDFSTALEFAQRLVGPHKNELQLNSVHFTHQALGPLEHYLECFKCPVYFGASENQIRVSKEVLNTPIYGANPRVLSALEEQIEGITAHPKKVLGELGDQVSRYVRKNLNHELPSAQQTANHFHMSLSAFKKRLRLEHTCYQNICDQVRYKRCKELMRKDSMAIKEVAFELGFTNASTFNRAFKRWAGESPSGYKKRSRHEISG